MSAILPQQRLLLELLIMSGDIAVTTAANDALLWRTLRECQKAGWITLRQVAPDIHRAIITPLGRTAAAA